VGGGQFPASGGLDGGTYAIGNVVISAIPRQSRPALVRHLLLSEAEVRPHLIRVAVKILPDRQDLLITREI